MVSPSPRRALGPAGRPYASVSIPAAHEEAHAGTGRMTLDQSCDPDPGCAGWPMVGRAGAEMISGREGSTKGRTRIFVGLINSQPSGHATLGQGAERRPRARIMAPPTSGLAESLGGRRAAPSVQRIPPGRTGIGSRSDPFRPPPAPHLRVIPFGGPFEPKHDETVVTMRSREVTPASTTTCHCSRSSAPCARELAALMPPASRERPTYAS
jgi:hypothetical protein